MFKIKKNLEMKSVFAKGLFYFILMGLGIIFFLIQQKIVGIFIISYILLEILNCFFNIIFEKLKKKYTIKIKKGYFIEIVCLLLLMLLFINNEFIVIFTFLGMILYIIFQFELITTKDFNPLKYFTIKDKAIFGGYLFYSIVVLVIKKKCNLDNDDYITFQLVYFSKIFDYFKDKLTNEIVGGNLKIVNEFEKINKKNDDEEQKQNSIKLINIWKKSLEFDDKEEVKNTVLKLSKANKNFLKEKIKELDEQINKIKKNNIATKKQIKKLEKIKNRTVNKNEISLVEFILYKTDAEKIISKVDDYKEIKTK